MYFIFAFLLMWGVTVSFAQQTPLNTACTDTSKFDWIMNPESDIDKYQIYMKDTAGLQKSDTILTEIDHDPSKVVFDTDGIGHFEKSFNSAMAEGSKWFAVTAVDNTGNESGFSNEMGCSLNISPSNPSGFLITKKNVRFLFRITIKQPS